MAKKNIYVDLDLNKQKLTNFLSNPMPTSLRTALALTSADTGYVVYDTTELLSYTWNGTTWSLPGFVPVGQMTMFTSVLATPTGFLKCDGSAVSRTTYSALFGDRKSVV